MSQQEPGNIASVFPYQESQLLLSAELELEIILSEHWRDVGYSGIQSIWIIDRVGGKK
jgi:hypothetical protein